MMSFTKSVVRDSWVVERGAVRGVVRGAVRGVFL